MDQYNLKFGKHFLEISPDTESFLLAQSWPGNVRELRNAMERVILIENGDRIKPEHFHFLTEKNSKNSGMEPINGVEAGLDYHEVTKGLIITAMKKAHGNVAEAARRMNIPPHKLRYRIKKYQLAHSLN
jgi:transcriptional regulator with PAS, ATPase and Fis domain